MIYKKKMNAQVLIKFMKQLIKRAGKKIYLILDNLRVHHAKLVKDWLKEHPKEIEVFYLPSYSPELNPDEYLNCDLKAGVHSRPPSRNQEALIKKVRSHMIKLQKLPARVSSYFKHLKSPMQHNSIFKCRVNNRQGTGLKIFCPFSTTPSVSALSCHVIA